MKNGVSFTPIYSDKEINMNKNFVLVLKAVALAMGVAVIVLSILNAATLETTVSLLGFGLFALALASFYK
jgi:hypothetical protein